MNEMAVFEAMIVGRAAPDFPASHTRLSPRCAFPTFFETSGVACWPKNPVRDRFIAMLDAAW